MRKNVYEAKNHLSELVAAARNGEEVIICKNGDPQVVLKKVNGTKKQRKPRREMTWEEFTNHPALKQYQKYHGKSEYSEL